MGDWVSHVGAHKSTRKTIRLAGDTSDASVSVCLPGLVHKLPKGLKVPIMAFENQFKTQFNEKHPSPKL